tara:strand:- start:437 stop:856 length:420 start_codon:yes stop_codon:yes gene_type:complete
MAKQLQNLIDKYGADELHRMIDTEVARQQDLKQMQEIMSTHLGAKQWFTKFAKANKLSVKECYNQRKERQQDDYDRYGKSCLALNGWRSDGPYVYLWLNRDDRPGLEMGSSIHDMYRGVGYNDTLAKIQQIMGLRSSIK